MEDVCGVNCRVPTVVENGLHEGVVIVCPAVIVDVSKACNVAEDFLLAVSNAATVSMAWG